jgi:ubiquinone/menaquinone biosynthesis C-methylase UbiE
VKTKNAEQLQKEFNFDSPRPRSFIASLPSRIDDYEEGVARFFQWKTGLDYYHAIDAIIDMVINSGRMKILDLLTDTAVFPLRLAERKAFNGHIYSVDCDVTLLERAKQRTAQLNLQKIIEFKQVLQETRLPMPDESVEAAVSFFDLQRHSIREYFAEIMRLLMPDGLFVIGVLTEPKADIAHRVWRWVNLKYIRKNPTEADTIYPDREDLIKSLFNAGFRQVIVQELSSPTTLRPGVFSMIAATK